MNLFKSEEERNRYIEINAQRQIDWEKGLTYFDKVSGTNKLTLQALNPRSMEEAMEISIRQVEYDEKKGVLRYSVEDLFNAVDNLAEFSNIEHKRYHDNWVEEFKKL